MPTILIGAVVAGALELIKVLTPKFGAENSKKFTFGLLFVLVFAGTYVVSNELISKEAIAQFVGILTSAVTTYELIIKGAKVGANKLGVKLGLIQ